mmetsp:Transcript_18600/g.27586  ORF Transcript_18600/g.27586 Transcript_18600/m.27586 type:complete len:242 (+) Transcript_18600:99-824(+)|eukprot:CAMPEP_0194233998 /NCGR_PEP_ID=MMETSP0158-20130606/1826_1 /TAXON_ID=33649 /ORGANISM="Thalassionema nitzschioides, Strain L26-B" /LENGTH=241 /DNA_ID=CAMNT_0038967047 /DNA_START=79 /DNA_END=804 /DNA_ORIENTATION=-
MIQVAIILMLLTLVGSFPLGKRIPNATRGKFSTALNYNDLPTIEQVSTDSFTDQAYYASTIVKELVLASSNVISNHNYEPGQLQKLQDLVTIQLSHQDGIRGFFSAYLTQEGDDTPADAECMPVPLSKAMKCVDMALLAPLACMNVIRPVAMSYWHKDPTLKENSAKTAERGKKILTSLRGSVNFVRNFEAIYAITSGSKAANVDEKLYKLWDGVFRESNYSKEQKNAIARTFADFLAVKN